MPIIRPSSDLRNNYNEISTICHETNKPIYITKNGAGDLAVMSIELYEKLTERGDSAEKTLEETKPEQHKKEKINITNETKEPQKSKTEQKTEPKAEKVQNVQEQVRKITEKPEAESGHDILQDVGVTVPEIKPKLEKKTENVNTEDKKPVIQTKTVEKKENVTTTYKTKEPVVNHIYNQKYHTTNAVTKKIDTEIKSTGKTQPESGHGISQGIKINSEGQGKEYSTKNNTFRELDTTHKTFDEKQKQVAKGISGGTGINTKSEGNKNNYNNDWIFEDLNKMLNDIKI